MIMPRKSIDPQLIKAIRYYQGRGELSKSTGILVKTLANYIQVTPEAIYGKFKDPESIINQMLEKREKLLFLKESPSGVKEKYIKDFTTFYYNKVEGKNYSGSTFFLDELIEEFLQNRTVPIDLKSSLENYLGRDFYLHQTPETSYISPVFEHKIPEELRKKHPEKLYCHFCYKEIRGDGYAVHYGGEWGLDDIGGVSDPRGQHSYVHISCANKITSGDMYFEMFDFGVDALNLSWSYYPTCPKCGLPLFDIAISDVLPL